MATLQIPEFISANTTEIQNDLIAFYESLTGKKVNPADVEMFIFNTMAYRETIQRNDANSAALQNLVDFASFPVLDYLGALTGVKRNPAAKAATTISFELQTGHSGVVIQAGTRVSHTNGIPIFEVIEDVVVPIGTDTVDVVCYAIDAGSGANGFAIGTISLLLDTFTSFDSCYNTDITSGGSEQETDDQLRERIKLSAAQFSVAGPIDAYIFHALSAHPDIIDVKIKHPQNGVSYPPPGTVGIYVLTKTLPVPTPVLTAVENKFTESIVPITDTQEVFGATEVNQNITINLTLFNGADDQVVTQQVTDALNAYKAKLASKLGIDIVRSQITALAMVDTVYNANVTSPSADVEVDESEVAKIGTITINVIGYTNG